MGYTKSAIKGISWVSLLRFFFRSSGFIRTAILARLLTPAQFGVFGIAAIVLGLVEMLTETGINVFLIQNEQEESLETYLNTAWVISIIRGLTIGVLIILLTPIISYFFENSQVIPLLLLSSLVPIIRGFINPAIVKFQKNLDFHQDFWFRSSIILVDSLVAITFAFIFRSAASLILGLIAGATTEVILSLLLVKPKPSFKFEKQQFSHIIHRGKWITFAGIMKYIADKGPDVVVGKTFPSSALGYYQMAYRFTILPIGEISEVFNKVSFPIYVKINSDLQRLKKAFLKNLAVISISNISIALLIFFFAEIFTKIVLGEQWLSVVPVMRALSLAAIALSLNTPTNPLFLSLKKQNYLALFTLIRMATIFITILPLTLSYGLVGAAISLLISYLTPLPFRYWLAYKSLKISTI